MTLGGPVRWTSALAGLFLWLAIPIVVDQGSIAKHAWRCRGRVFNGTFDDCFNDYIPVLEVVFIPFMVLVAAYPFARLAFSLYGPSTEPRSLAWKLSTRGGAASGWPWLQLVACIGCAWAVWRGLTYAPVPELLPFRLYWAAFCLWFAAGAAVGFIDRRAIFNAS